MHYSNSFDSKKTISSFNETVNIINPILKEKICKKTNRGRKSLVELPQGKKCDICLEFLQYSIGQLVQCTICSSEFHCSCYKYSISNEESFVCERCLKAKEAGKAIQSYTCFICGRCDGVLYQKEDSNQFYHEICLRFIPELNDEEEETSKTTKRIRRWRYKNSCRYCKDKLCKTKAVIKCNNPKCKCFYHIPCAIQKGMIFSMRFQLSYNNITDLSVSIPFYCCSHNKKIFNAYRNEINQLNKTALQNEVSSNSTTEEVTEMDMETDIKDEELPCAYSNALNLNFNDLIESTTHSGNKHLDSLVFNSVSLTDINPFEVNYKEMGFEDDLFFSFDVFDYKI